MNGTSWPDIVGVGRQFTGQFHKDPLYPQPANIFSADNMFFDRKGSLHLRIAQEDGDWTSAEIVSDESFGYGRYSFRLGTLPDKLPDGVVLGMFTWDDANEPSHREIDIEFGVDRDPTLTFTVHPGEAKRFPFYPDNDVIYSFVWRPDSVEFEIRDSSNLLIESYIFSDDIKVRMNLWLIDGEAPASAGPIEAVIEDFDFRPYEYQP